MRTFDKTVDSVKRHLLDKYDCSVFIHTWDVFGTTRKEDVDGSTSISVDAIKEAYSPVELLIEPQRQFEMQNHFCFFFARTPPHDVKSKWYSAKTAFELIKKSGQSFDLILSMRPDMLLHDDVQLTLENNVLFVPGNIQVPIGMLHDYFGFGDPLIMERYFSLYENFDEICNNTSKFRPELIFTNHILKQKLPIKYCNLEYSLVRLSGEIRRC